MALSTRDGHYFGDAPTDIREYLFLFSTANGYATEHFRDAVCTCGSRLFRLLMDDDAGAAVRVCKDCRQEHPIGDSEDFLEDADLEESECLCGASEFEITAGVALYRESEDVKWLYIGCRCPQCSLVGCYGHWKNEYIGYIEFLDRV